MDDVSPEVRQMVWRLAKITLALGALGFIIMYTPIFELMYYFSYVVVIPLSVLALVGIISNETFEVFELAADELKWRVREARDNIKNQAMA